MKQITIQIPEKKDWVRWWDIVKFKTTGGFTCKKCGAKNKFNCVRFDSEVNDKAFMLHNSTPGICPNCTLTELVRNYEIVFTEHNCKCDWCDEHKNTMSFPRHSGVESNVTFGSNYWNGHHICEDCLQEAFYNRGPLKSDIGKYENGKRYLRNELGLWIEEK